MFGRHMRIVAAAAVMFALAVMTQSSEAQDNNAGGVEIDAQGVMRARALTDRTGMLDREKIKAAKASLNEDLRKASDMRSISLNRLEAEVAKYVEAGRPIPDDMKYLAGMTRITHVFYYPETKDIVIAGPAEGFYKDGLNRVVGTDTGKATLQLQDLIVALRSFSPKGNQARLISCSIDPTKEGLARLRQAVSDVQQQGFRNENATEVANLFRQSIGNHVVTVKGVSPKTNFARIMVEADYHMKLIGIGLEQPPVKIKSFIASASPNSVAQNALQRWYFQPNYECVKMTEDETAMQLVDSGVKLVGANESVAQDGSRTNTGNVGSRASRNFCNQFTKMYDRLSEKAPLYSELRNVIDMSIAAAFIQEMDFYGQSGWEMNVFGDESKIPVETYKAPKQVEAALNAVWKNGKFMTPIGGGVNIQPRAALSSSRMKTDAKGEVMASKKKHAGSDLQSGQWWWD